MADKTARQAAEEKTHAKLQSRKGRTDIYRKITKDTKTEISYRRVTTARWQFVHNYCHFVHFKMNASVASSGSGFSTPLDHGWHLSDLSLPITRLGVPFFGLAVHRSPLAARSWSSASLDAAAIPSTRGRAEPAAT
jgi:hypothetical protein